MAQFVVRSIENSVKLKLQRRAKKHGHSMEEEIRDILRSAVNDEDTERGGLGTEISSLFVKSGLECEIPELRGHEIRPASFEQ